MAVLFCAASLFGVDLFCRHALIQAHLQGRAWWQRHTSLLWFYTHCLQVGTIGRVSRCKLDEAWLSSCWGL